MCVAIVERINAVPRRLFPLCVRLCCKDYTSACHGCGGSIHKFEKHTGDFPLQLWWLRCAHSVCDVCGFARASTFVNA